MKEKYVVCGKGFPNAGQHTAYPGFSLPQYYLLGSLSVGGLKNFFYYTAVYFWKGI